MTPPPEQLWQLAEAVDVDGGRRRLVFRLSNGTRRSVVITQADDNDDIRSRIGDALESGNRRLIRGNTTIEG